MKYEDLKNKTIEEIKKSYTDEPAPLWEALLEDSCDFALLKKAQRAFKSMAKRLPVDQLYEAWIESNEDLIDPNEINEPPAKKEMISDLWLDLEEVLLDKLTDEDIEIEKKARIRKK